MWNAFGNGSGSQGGGGGYASKAKVWEFVPCSKLEGGTGGTRSPLRARAPPASAQPSPPSSSNVPLEASRGQVFWREQSQLSRMRKKVEDLKERHDQEKEEWMREKEILLRQIADIQGGENRRLLLDVKAVLEDVQLEVKREEAKRSELQLEYTKDRCAWELERADLKCRIAQLEARGGIAAPGGAGESLHRECAAQCRLLADKRWAVLERSERGWARERAEMLQRFQDERSEWQQRLVSMQRNIEELCEEVRVRCEGGAGAPWPNFRVDISSVSETQPCQTSSTNSKKSTNRSISAININGTINTNNTISANNANGTISANNTNSTIKTNNSISANNTNYTISTNNTDSANNTNNTNYTISGNNTNSTINTNDSTDTILNIRSTPAPPTQCTSIKPTETEPHHRIEPPTAQPQGGAVPTAGGQTAAMAELEAILNEYLVEGKSSPPPPCESLLLPFTGLQNMEISCLSDKKKNTTAVNTALREIARVSEELCSFQDKIRRKSEMKGSSTTSLCSPGSTGLGGLEGQAGTEPQTWTLWEGRRPTTVTTQQASPVPVLSTSLYMNASSAAEVELNVPQSTADRKCPSPCVGIGRRSSSPSVVRRFEAMLQENEGKVLTHGGVASCPAPTHTRCHGNCCHNRRSCDGSWVSNRSSLCMPAQKCFSECNNPAVGMDCGPAHRDVRPGVDPVALWQANPDPQATSPWPDGSSSSTDTRKNERLEQKMAEFNRTLFQTDMGCLVSEGRAPPAGLDAEGERSGPEYLQVTCRGASQVNTAVQSQCPQKNMPHITVQSQCLQNSMPNTALQSQGLQNRISNTAVQSQRPQNSLPHITAQSQGPLWNIVDTAVQSQNVMSSDTLLQPGIRVKDLRSETSDSILQSARLLNREATPSHPELDLSRSSVLDPDGNRPVTPVTPVTPVRMRQLEAAGGQAVRPVHPSEVRTQCGQRQTDLCAARCRVLQENPWRPLTLSAYPRPPESRSNYGAVERILRSYGKSAQPQCPSQPPPCSELLTEQLNQCDIQQQQTQRGEDVAAGSRGFSRPCRPGNRRLPSRWASRSPSPGSSSGEHTSMHTHTHTETVII